MDLKSDMMSSVLKILLIVLVALASVDLAMSVVFALGEDAFAELLSDIYGFVIIVETVLHYIVLVIFLIWIYRVHMDLNRLFLQYPRSPGKALAYIMIPLFNVCYGIPSTFMIIGNCFRQQSALLYREGQWIRGLAIPAILLALATDSLDRMIARVDEISDSLLVTEGLFTLATYIVYLALCLLISSGLNLAQAVVLRNTTDSLPEQSAAANSGSL